jgi:hypothetical protein
MPHFSNTFAQRKTTAPAEYHNQMGNKCVAVALACYTTLTLRSITVIKWTVVRFKVLTAVVMKSKTFWDITPCSPLSVNRRFGGTYRLHLQQMLATSFHSGFFLKLYFSTLKMEAICSSETSVDTQRTTWCYIPEDCTLQLNRCS